MEDNTCDLKLQRDRCLHKSKEVPTFLSEVKNDLFPLKFVGPPFDQVSELVRTMEMKDQVVSVLRSTTGATHKKLDLLCSQNASLTQQMVNFTSLTL